MNNRDALTFFFNISKPIQDNQILIEESERTCFFNIYKDIEHENVCRNDRAVSDTKK